MSENGKTYYYPVDSKKYLDDEGGYDPIEPLDYDEYLELIRDGKATQRHHDEFHYRMLWHFILCVGGGEQPKQFVMNALADIFLKITQGGRWDDEIPMPWSDRSSPFSQAERKDLDIFCQIGNRLMTDKNQNITSIIEDVARSNNVSFEKARAAWYARRGLLTNNDLQD